MKFVHHCCGRVVSFVPLMVECGSDVWNLQIGANEDMLPRAIEEYGDRLFESLV